MNFCIEKIGTTISSSQVESDGNECKNLLDPDPTTGENVALFASRSRGFLTENFVRPPVTLSIRFPTCLEISHIIINPKYGTQSSSAFTIQTETSYVPWRSGMEVKSVKHIVAKEFINSPILPNEIFFHNPRFVARPPFSLLHTSSCQRKGSSISDELSFNLKHPSPIACERVIGLEITILRVTGSSVPTLGGLQVWGQPCVRCPKDITNKLLVMWMRRTRKRNITEAVNFSNNKEDENSSKRQRMNDETDSSVSVRVPEEYMDPITHEIMVQPIRLPCGVAVDASTLEKYYNEEATWARSPNDPFTGQAYTDSIKPIADGALKTLIDYFLTQNSHCKSLQSVPRTVGTGSAGAGIKGLCRQQFMTFKPSQKYVQSLSPPPAAPPPPLFGFPDFENVSSSTFMTNKNSIIMKKPSTSVSSHQYQHSQSDEMPVSVSSSAPTTQPMSMEDLLQEEMAKILGGGSSYVAKPPEKEPLNYLTQCVMCKESLKHLEKTTIVYSSSTCPHIFVCRPCVLTLSKQGTQTCAECRSNWSIKELQRNHGR